MANTNTVYYYITATDDGADQSEAKTSVYPNNTDHDQLGFHVSDNLTIGMVQETPWPSGNTLYEGCNVTLTGSVTADTAQYTSGYSSYAFQDGTGQWNGLVFDTEEMAIVTRGDEVSVTGLVTDNESHYKMPHIGSVFIKDNVWVGSNCCIDRGTIENTIIDDGTKLDNFIQVAHNVKIGKNCRISGQTAIAGSARVGPVDRRLVAAVFVFSWCPLCLKKGAEAPRLRLNYSPLLCNSCSV